MADRTITTDLVGRDRMSTATNSAARGMDRLRGVAGKVGGVMKAGLAGGAVAAAAGIAFLGSKIVQGVKDADNYNKLGLRTAAVIKSTGNQAGISVKGIQALGDELEGLSGVDAELVINSQNVLATFTNIKNVGKDKIFDQATRSTLDMSEALGTDLQGASIQVGKALNDPIKGVTALSKVGVSFTEQQKKVIAKMVETGDVAGAQKIILAELNKEFGGQAAVAGKTFEGAMTRAKNAMDDVFQEVGQALLPRLASIADSLAKKIPAAVESFKAGWAGMDLAGSSGQVSDLAEEFKALSTGIQAASTDFTDGAAPAMSWSTVIGDQVNKTTALFTDGVEQWNQSKNWFQRGWAEIAITVGKVSGKSKEDMDKMQREFDKFDTATTKAEIVQVQTQLRRLNNQRTNPKVSADTSSALRKLAALSAKLHRIPDEYVNVFINEIQRDNVTGGHHVGRVGGRASGGAMTAGTPYHVAERTPEIFVPSVSGRMHPLTGGGGGGNVTNYYTVHVVGVTGQDVVKALEQLPAGSRKIPARAVA